MPTKSQVRVGNVAVEPDRGASRLNNGPKGLHPAPWITRGGSSPCCVGRERAHSTPVSAPHTGFVQIAWWMTLRERRVPA